MKPDVAERCRTEQGIHHGVQKHVRIRMAEQTFFIRNFHAAQDQVTSFCQAVRIVSRTDSHPVHLSG